MKHILFEWDENKEKNNIKKHGLPFSEAATVFADDAAFLFDDPEHSDKEDRFILLGMSTKARICVVCHCYRTKDSLIRIISARRATRKEEERYVRGI